MKRRSPEEMNINAPLHGEEPDRNAIPCKDYLSIWTAYLYALRKHGDQKDRAGKPYILHPVHVAVFTSELTDDPEIITAAMLHDTVEDTDATLEEIRDNMDLSRFEHPTEKDYKRLKKYQKALDILNGEENA